MSGQDEKHNNNADIVKATRNFIDNAQAFFDLLEDKYNMPIRTNAPDDEFFKFLDWSNLSLSQKAELNHRSFMKLI